MPPVVAMAGLPIALPKVGARIVLNEPGMSLLGYFRSSCLLRIGLKRKTETNRANQSKM
jgi:hypothetical protein